MTHAHATSSELVGPYRVVRAIGAGGSARIDLAVIERAYGFSRSIVLKRPLEHLRGDAHVAETLRREAHLGGRLRHPNLVAVLDAGTHDGYVYLALEYVAGPSVRSIMQADGSATVRALPLPAALSIIVGAARGLHEAHELTSDEGAPLGLVHRDVSPANILIDRDGTVKLSDFGIAKDTRVSTLSGSMRGTVTYMAPEQCRGHAFDRRADVFSLGVILHELISGRRLFWAENDVASLHKVLSAPLPDPREAVPSLPPELCAIAMRAIARDAHQRMPSAAELADRIEAFAARAGIVLGARAVAPLIATEHVPVEVSKQLTAPLRASASEEPSLVTVIESAPDVEAIEPTFGPNAAGDDEIATPVRQPTAMEHLAVPSGPTRSRRLLLGAIAACVVGGIAIGAVIAMRGDGPSRDAAAVQPTEARPTPQPTVVEADAATEDIEATAPGDAEADVAGDLIELEPAPGSASAPVKTSRKRPRDKRPDRGATKTDRTPTTPDAGVAPPQPDAGAPKVEWNPKIVFPGDQPK
ncbi:MAG: serine/threonine protein kinase [Kofleriaceae bacterium]